MTRHSLADAIGKPTDAQLRRIVALLGLRQPGDRKTEARPRATAA